MANVNSVQHTQKVAQVGGLSNLSVAWATYEIATNPADNDTMTMFTLPAGTTVHAGWLKGDDLDSGTDLEIDVGDASSSTRFLNSAVLSGDAVTGTKPEVGISISLFGTLKDGPYTYTTDTNIILTEKVNAGTGGTGTITLTMLVTYNDARVSPPTKPL